jgi:hypothetical protein
LILHNDNALVDVFASSWLRSPIPDLAPCNFWLFPNLKMSWGNKDLLTFRTSNTMHCYCEVFWKTIFKTVSSSGTIVPWSAYLHKESISKATAAPSTQVSKFCSQRASLELNFRTMYCINLFASANSLLGALERQLWVEYIIKWSCTSFANSFLLRFYLLCK